MTLMLTNVIGCDSCLLKSHPIFIRSDTIFVILIP